MSAPLAPLTELEAVNEMLSTLGESPISTLEENQVMEASLALRILRTEALSLQNKGWSFNTDQGYRLEPDVTGQLKLPRNALRCDTTGDDAALDLVIRGNRLYDRARHTYEISRSVLVDITVALPFEELPSTARSYVTIRAARVFQDRYGGDDGLHAYTKRDEDAAYASLVDEEVENTDPNMLRDSAGSRQLLRRSYQ